MRVRAESYQCQGRQVVDSIDRCGEVEAFVRIACRQGVRTLESIERS